MRLQNGIYINPFTKLNKNENFTFVDMESILTGCKKPILHNDVMYMGQSCSKFQKGDTLMARITPCLENGKIAKYHGEGNGFGSTEFIVFRAKSEITDSDYIYYLLKLKYIKDLSVNSMTGASGRQRADSKFIGRIKWNFPKLATQQKIANILSTYDELIENYQKQIKILEQMAENLYKEWFVRFRFPGYETAEFENGIPKGWKQGIVADIVEFKRGKNITAEDMIIGDVPVISAGLEPSGCHNKANVDYKSITISASGANSGFISFHFNKIWAADCNVSTKNEYIFFCYQLLNKMRDVISNLQVGSAQPHVYSKDINRIKIILPNQVLMRKANDKLELLYIQINNFELKIKNLQKQRDLLLPRLMSGKLEVKMENKEKLQQHKFSYINEDWKNRKYDSENFGMAARKDGSISEETISKLKAIAEEDDE